jgi:DNA-binding NtrC family response regulator
MMIETILPAGCGASAAELIGTSPAIEQLRQLVRKVARTQATILIRGECGSGKSFVAAALHRQSPRAEMPFYRIHCAGRPAATLERELFGFEKSGGSEASIPGLFELARGGTIVLSEVAELPAGIQSRLLQVLQEETFERTGGTQSLKADVRVIATTSRDLEARIRRGEFREDLFIRLGIVPVSVPALRERKEDIAALATHFCQGSARKRGIDAPPLSPAASSAIENHAWPGNTRELQQRIEMAVATALPGGILEPSHLGFADARSATLAAFDDPDFVEDLTEVEKRHILVVLDRCKWNRGNAATRLGISIRTLRNKLKDYQRGSADVESKEESTLKP